VNKRLYLLDGTLLFFRALYGTPDVFQDDAQRPVNGVRGYLSYLLKLLQSRAVERCVAAFDESLNSCWRNDIYPEYKANRPPADDNIRHQLDRCRQITELLGIPVLADAAYEADDFIATLVRNRRRDAVIVTRDKDLQQLLEPGVELLDPSNEAVATAESFSSAFAFPPMLFPDYQALTGDSVDNIPGVRGIGPKIASRLVSTFGSLESIYAAATEWEQAGLKPASKAAGRLRDEQDQAFLFRQILRLDDQVPLADELGEAPLPKPESAVVENHLAQLGLGGALGQNLQRKLESFCG
jgi:5'-3' exonuclease